MNLDLEADEAYPMEVVVSILALRKLSLYGQIFCIAFVREGQSADDQPVGRLALIKKLFLRFKHNIQIVNLRVINAFGKPDIIMSGR
jgi:hypothetical protein